MKSEARTSSSRTKKNARRTEESPLFRAMVVMGSSLAVGCSGTVTERNAGPDPGDSDSSTPGNQGSGGSSARGTGGAAASGAGATNTVPPANTGAGGAVMGPPPISTGPHLMPVDSGLPPSGSGGSSPVTDGGNAPIVEGGVRLPPCPLPQWECSSQSLLCDGFQTGWRYESADGCVCNLKRPRSVGDCAKDEKFVCQVFTASPTDENLNAPFQCECIAGTTSCDDACQKLEPAGSLATACNDDGSDNYLCGCAVVSLR